MTTAIPARNEIIVAADHLRLELTQGQYALIDEVDLALVAGYRWYAAKRGDHFYVQTALWDSDLGRQRTVFLHRLLLSAPSGCLVDHINHEPLDNRRANLRLVSSQENNENRAGASTASQTGVRGVLVVTKRRNYGRQIYRYYLASVRSGAQRHTRRFPYTDQGFLDAQRAVLEMREQLYTCSDGR